MGMLIGNVPFSACQRDADSQIDDLLMAGVRRNDLDIDYGVSGARTSRAKLDKAVAEC